MASDTAKPARITSIDAYRGLVMFLMMASGMAIYKVAENFPDSPTWPVLGYHTNHVIWAGCSLHDMIQPSFSFLVGVALPFSIASRLARGNGFGWMLVHAVWRAFLLIALGVFLRSNGATQTNFTFEDTLSQIGFGYVFLFLLGFRSPAWHWGTLVVILVGYGAAFAAWPLPAEGFDLKSVGVTHEGRNPYTGFLAHWNINTNPAAAFDRWFLNLFGRQEPFIGNGDGYATLSFIPTLGTMILGLIAGTWMKNATSRGALLVRLFLAGVICLGIGYGLDAVGVCPNVKKIWTPTWTLYSGGICFLMLLCFTLLFDGGSPLRILAFPLVVIGANSIFIYSMNGLIGGWIKQTLLTHLKLPESYGGFHTYTLFGPEYETIVRGALVILIFWLILLWMYCKRIFIKI